MLKLKLNSKQVEKKSNISFIGLGNMGESIAKAISFQNKEFNSNISIGLFDKDSSTLNKVEKELVKDASNTYCYNSIKELVNNSAIIFLCVKPQTLSYIYKDLKESKDNDSCFISIAAGVNLKTLSEKIQSKNICRFMPNIAAKAKKAVTAVANFETCSESHIENSMNIANSFGSAFALNEDKFSAFTGISGSAIAFVFEFAHALALGGTVEGIAYNQAVEIAFDTIESAFSLYKMEKEHPVSLATKVCSAGGTTIEGMKTLSDNGFDSAIINAVVATTKKSKDLEKNS